MNTKIIALCAGALTLSACDDMGANYTPILDGAPTAAFHADLTECQELARAQKQLDQETGAAAVLGAGAGAVFGALDGDMDVVGGAVGGAVAGALAGGVASAVDVSERRESIVIECLRGRGHRVVG
ncbi:MAG: glycine zipper family protein [Pseudomonadota bacterium]|nr:glycine zipper family protein [Pseudomonadota bacterium]